MSLGKAELVVQRIPLLLCPPAQAFTCLLAILHQSFGTDQSQDEVFGKLHKPSHLGSTDCALSHSSCSHTAHCRAKFDATNKPHSHLCSKLLCQLALQLEYSLFQQVLFLLCRLCS